MLLHNLTPFISAIMTIMLHLLPKPVILLACLPAYPQSNHSPSLTFFCHLACLFTHSVTWQTPWLTPSPRPLPLTLCSCSWTKGRIGLRLERDRHCVPLCKHLQDIFRTLSLSLDPLRLLSPSDLTPSSLSLSSRRHRSHYSHHHLYMSSKLPPFPPSTPPFLRRNILNPQPSSFYLLLIFVFILSFLQLHFFPSGTCTSCSFSSHVNGHIVVKRFV